MGGTVLTQPDGGGGAENRAKEVLQGAAGARLSEQTSELRTFPRWRGGNRRPWSYFQLKGGAGVRPWASRSWSPCAWSRALGETPRVSPPTDHGGMGSQAGPFTPPPPNRSTEHGRGTNSTPAQRTFLRHIKSHRWKIL